MGIILSPFVTIQLFLYSSNFIRRDNLDPENPLIWDNICQTYLEVSINIQKSNRSINTTHPTMDWWSYLNPKFRTIKMCKTSTGGAKNLVSGSIWIKLMWST